MMRAAVAAAALCALAALVLVPARPAHGRPLWPGARHTVEQRDLAVQRGMRFLTAMARDPAVFRQWGHDLIGAFQAIAATSSDPRLRAYAWSVGRERAAEWRRLNPSVPPGAVPKDVTVLLMGSDAAARLGLPDRALWNQLRVAAARFTPSEYLGFDPAVEPPPSGKPLETRSRYETWLDTLVITWSGDRHGITLGANYVDALHWLPAMRPYPRRGSVTESEYLDAVYAVTHLIYTLNDYSLYRLDPRCLPDEFAFLSENLRQAIDMQDPETAGEFLDSLRAFGLGLDDSRIRTGVEYLLSSQNPDGSWGDPKDPDPYDRYHATWTAIDGLRDYLWGPAPLPCVAP